jgi:hypothetical protein
VHLHLARAPRPFSRFGCIKLPSLVAGAQFPVSSSFTATPRHRPSKLRRASQRQILRLPFLLRPTALHLRPISALIRRHRIASGMAHLPRFHRRKKDVAAPTLITSDLPDKSAPAQGGQRSGSPARSFQKLSPFRVFHRSSGKRARDSPPASLPHSPAAASVLPGDGADGRPVSPLSLKTDPASEDGLKRTKAPKMPAFLDQSQAGEPVPASAPPPSLD